MTAYKLSSPYIKIAILSEFDNLDTIIQPYLYSYAVFEKEEKLRDNYDVMVCVFKKDMNFEFKVKPQLLGIITPNLEHENQIMIKRLLINVINRVLESKGTMFLHASSVVYGNSGIMFLGDSGAGKTTNMLYMLDVEGVFYMSNDATGLMLDKNKSKIIMFGVPSEVNIRPGSLEAYPKLKRKILPFLEQNEDQGAMVQMTDNFSMNRMEISLGELKNAMQVKECSIADMKGIVLVQYNPHVQCEIVNIGIESLLSTIKKYKINGVYDSMSEVENVAEVCRNSMNYEVLKTLGKNFRIIKIVQNCNNSNKILDSIIRLKGEITYGDK